MWVALKRAGCCGIAFGGYINRALSSFFQEIRLSTSMVCTSLNTNFFQNFVLVAEYHVVIVVC